MDLKEAIRVARAIAKRDGIILTDPNHLAKKGQVNLHWWELSQDKQNVGDMLSPVVVEYVRREKNISALSCDGMTRHLYAIGSIIDGGYQNATIWGSGIIREKPHYWWKSIRKLDIRAVRGPETRRVLINNGYTCPEQYGDPAILMPRIYRPSVEKTKDFVVVPHMTYGVNYPNAICPLTSDWKLFIDELLTAKLVISSSLHGIILAEAYGIPAILLNDHDMNLFKYRDYYYGTGRFIFPVAQSVEEAISMDRPAVPDFSQQQNELINTFPYELWENM